MLAPIGLVLIVGGYFLIRGVSEDWAEHLLCVSRSQELPALLPLRQDLSWLTGALGKGSRTDTAPQTDTAPRHGVGQHLCLARKMLPSIRPVWDAALEWSLGWVPTLLSSDQMPLTR